MRRLPFPLASLALLTASLALAGPKAAPAAGPRALVFCAPGYPGTTEEAQPRMDEIAAALAEGAGWPKEQFGATYFPQEKAGLTRLAQPDVVLALVPLPFFLQHEAGLKLTARLAVVQQDREAEEGWTLVAKKGAVKKAADLDGYTVFSTAGYAPNFVTKVALGGFGPLPASVKVTTGGQVLSALRKAAAGAEKLAVVLDAEQAKALPTLPFAPELEVVHVGAKAPVAVVATLGDRLSAADWKAVQGALSKLASTPKGKAALEGVRLTGFVPLDDAALAAAKKAFGGATK
ncbi:MAG: PhnD/SsuA/transferrin family substrate-binding protein [Myxococcales bacterium]|nr:PhnD/SsuA/transferrin family substrate-binding protein [Myxococcales bacterium]